MKIIDNNGRLFGKISVIEVIVVLIVAVMAVALYLKTNTMTHTSTTVVNDKITYQVLARAVPDYVDGHMQVGDHLYDNDNASGGCLGEIKALEILPGEEMVTFDDATMEVVPSEGTINLLLTIEGEGLIDNGSYMLNRVYALGVNAGRNFATEYVRFAGTVVSIG